MADEEQPKCPVDHSARSAWLNQSVDLKQEKLASQQPQEQPVCPVDHTSRAEWMKNVSVTASTPEAIEVASGSHSADTAYPASNVNLPTEREISSIPRTSASANWIYPSQKQFFDAMTRKSSNPNATDMQTVVPIHNAVNERAWAHIMQWEQANIEAANKKCGGLSLTSFKGDLKKLTPRAWINSTLWGYQKPFDRHDWIIDRCGTEVEYVIDFYSGTGVGASFFLDVRPKLNSWEGVKLRVARTLGLS